MKKILLGTTALVTAAAFAAPASAADKIQLKLDGYATFAAAYVSLDDDAEDTIYGASTDTRGITFGSDAEVHFKGKTTLDNGLKIGFKAELELEDDCKKPGGTPCSADTIDEVYVELKGGFGEIEFGQQDGVGDQMHYYSPWVFVEHGANDNDLSALQDELGIAIQSIVDDSSDYTKVTYITPRIAGFQLGVSYTPEAARNGPDSYNSRVKSDGDSIVEIGGNFVETFNDIDVAISATYLTASGETAGTDDGDAYSIGTTIGFAGFQIGGSYTERDDDDAVLGTTTFTGEESLFDVGATYGTGPWTFGIMYASGDYEPVSGADVEDMAIVGGVAYALGPGISLGLGAEYAERDVDGVSSGGTGSGDTAAAIDGDGFSVFTELALDF